MFIRPLWEYHTFMLRRMERIVRSAKMRIVGGGNSHGAKAPVAMGTMLIDGRRIAEMT